MKAPRTGTCLSPLLPTAVPVPSRCSVNVFVDWMGMSSADLWVFCQAGTGEGARGNPAASHFHLLVLKVGGAGFSGVRGAEVPRTAFGEGLGKLGSRLWTPVLGQAPDLEVEHTHLGESPFSSLRNQKNGLSWAWRHLGKRGKERGEAGHAQALISAQSPACEAPEA